MINDLQTRLVRLHQGRVPIWVLDPGEYFTDLRAILHGSQVKPGIDGTRINPFHEFMITPGDADELATLTKLLTGSAQDHATLSRDLGMMVDAWAVGMKFPGCTLHDVAEFLSGPHAPDSAETARAIRGMLNSTDPRAAIFTAPTSLKGRNPIQFSFNASDRGFHAAVVAAITRLATVAVRGYDKPLVLITIPIETRSDDFSALEWSPGYKGHIQHVRSVDLLADGRPQPASTTLTP